MREGTPLPPPLPLRYTIRVQLLCPVLHVVYVLSPRSRCWRKLCRETGGGGSGGGVRRLLRQPLRRLRLRLPWQQPPAEQAGHGGKVLFGGGGKGRKRGPPPSLSHFHHLHPAYTTAEGKEVARVSEGGRVVGTKADGRELFAPCLPFLPYLPFFFNPPSQLHEVEAFIL